MLKLLCPLLDNSSLKFCTSQVIGMIDHHLFTSYNEALYSVVKKFFSESFVPTKLCQLAGTVPEDRFEIPLRNPLTTSLIILCLLGHAISFY